MSRTNFQKIKDMSVEEMAEFISDIDCDECSGVTRIKDSEDLESIEKIKEWLQREVEE